MIDRATLGRRTSLRSLPRALSVIVLSLATLSIGACVDGTASSTRTGTCAATFVASASAGTTPTFTWTPAVCNVSTVVVTTSGGTSAIQWSVGAATNVIASGVKYGVVPPGAEESAPATPLVAGTTYQLLLYRRTATDVLVLAGSQTFTP